MSDLKLSGYTLPDAIQIAYAAAAVITVIGEIYLRNKIQVYKDVT